MVDNAQGCLITNEQLAAGAAAGDVAAFQALAQRFAQPAFAYAYHLLGSYDEANDAVQEALVQLYLALPKARHDLPFRPWFYQILRHKCLDALRQHSPHLHLPSGETDEMPEDQIPDTAPLPEELYEQKEVQHILHEVIGELEQKYREVVLLRYTTDLTFEEIGQALQLPINTVKTHFQRAKRLLRPLLLARQVGGEARRPVPQQAGVRLSLDGEEEHNVRT